jgi:hypothetical protein
LDFALARYNADGSLDATFRAEERIAATEGRAFAHTIPAGRFVDPDGDVLTLSAAQSDGNALPSWLAFDSAARTFSGTPPPESGDVHVRVTAADPAGLAATYNYWIYTNTAPVALARRFAGQLALPRGRAGKWLGTAMDLANASVTRRAVELLGPRPGEVVLDAGCGSGAALAAIRRHAPCDLIGIDRSATMIDAARRRLGDSASLRIGTVEELAPDTAGLDGALLLNVLYFCGADAAMRSVKELGVSTVTVRDAPAGAWPNSSTTSLTKRSRSA